MIEDRIYIKTFEGFTRTITRSLLAGDSIELNKIFDELKRKINFFGSYIFRDKNISVDRNFLNDDHDPEEIIKDVYMIMSLLEYFITNLPNKFSHGVSISWIDFYYCYEDLIKKYGHFPTVINSDLFNKIYIAFRSISNVSLFQHLFGEKYEKAKELINDLKIRSEELENNIKKYNL